MKIAVLNPRFHPPFGGATAVCFYIVEALQEEEHTIEYYSGADRDIEDVNDRFGLSINEDKLETEKVGVPLKHKILNYLGRGTVLKRSIEDRYFLNLAKNIEDDFDLIVLGRHVFDADLYFEKPVLQYVHDHLPEELDKPRFYKRFYSSYSRPALFSNADLNLYNSEYIASKNPQEGKVIYPPVDSEFDPEGERESRAVILGRIAQDKNMEEAIEIISETDLDLAIVGSAEEGSEYVEKLEGEAESRSWLEIKKNVPRNELREILETSKIGLSCKREENFGINVVEYMKAGLLPMVFNHAGPAEIVQEERYTYRDVEEASKKIERNLTEEGECREKILERSEDFGSRKFKEEVVECIGDIL